MAQLSSIKAVRITDVNGDGKRDVITGGNLFTFPPQFGRLDASYGNVLINDGKGRLTWIEPKRSGISVRGEIKGIEEIGAKDKPTKYLLIVQKKR
jgi:hypothetical protein